MLLSLLIIFCLLILVLSLYFRYSYAGRLMTKIPGSKGFPLVGHGYEICVPKDHRFAYLRSLPKKYGTIVKTHGLAYRAVHIYDPNDIKVIWSSLYSYGKEMPYSFLKPWLGDGLLISNGDKWHSRRKLLTPSFHFTILKQFFRVFVEDTEELIKALDKEVGKKQTDVMPIIKRATIQIMMETSMGLTTSDSGPSMNKYIEALNIMGQTLAERLTKFWTYPNFLFNFSNISKVQKAALKDLHSFTKQIIYERREYRKENKCMETNEDSTGSNNKVALLDMLLDMESAGKIDEAGIREEVDTFMFEGHDTTAAALYFMIMRLACERDIQNSIYEELHRVFGDSRRCPTMEELNELKYLECCIKESLRLYPSVPFTARYTKEEVVLSGYKVPPNTIIIIHPYDVHRRPELYPEPDKFIPERFLPENIEKRHPYAYIPFSAGPRNCIGQKFAMLEMKTIMSGLLRRFRFEPVTKHEDIHFHCDVVLRPSHPLYVQILRRNK